jgi:hypothetical protein
MTHHAARRPVSVALAGWLALAGAGCTAVKGLTGPDAAADDPSTIAAATRLCVDQVNLLRASVGDPPLGRSDTIDAFSTEAARVDGEAHEAHKYFLETNGGHGIATAENVIPWWKVSDWGSVDNVVRKGVSQMWAEGPSGYHYVNMRGGYTQMGCGIAVINGEVTVSQNFH